MRKTEEGEGSIRLRKTRAEEGEIRDKKKAENGAWRGGEGIVRIEGEEEEG